MGRPSKTKPTEWEIVASHRRPSDGEKVCVMKCPECGYFWPMPAKRLLEIGPKLGCGTCVQTNLVKLDHWHRIRGQKVS